MNKIILQNIDPNTIKNDNRFLIGLQFSRLYNVVVSNQRRYQRIENDGQPANSRDRLETIIYHSAIVFESIKSISDLENQLKGMSCWKDCDDKYRRVADQFHTKGSFWDLVLRRIRNRLIFHYDSDIIKTALEKFPITEKAVFAYSKDTKVINVAFTLIDEILIDYLVKLHNPDIPEKESLAQFQQKLLELSHDVTYVLQDVIIELLNDKIFWGDE